MAGMLMTPLIEFYISAEPPKIADSAAGFGVMTCFLFFSASIALINYTQLCFGRLHRESINNNLNAVNIQFTGYLRNTALLKLRGVLPDKGNNVSSVFMHKILGKESFVEFAMNYYQWICGLILFAIFVVLLCQPLIALSLINNKNSRGDAGF